MKSSQKTTCNIFSAVALLMLALLTFTGCKKDDKSIPRRGQIILKYELVSSVPFQSIPGVTSWSLAMLYTNATGNFQDERPTVTGTTWTKTVEFTSSQRPITIYFNPVGYTNGTTGTVTANIYENNVIKASTVFYISPLDNIVGIGQFGNGFGINYILQ